MRQKIPLGVLTASVEGWETVGQIHAPLSSLRTSAEEKAIAVFVNWSGLDDYAEQDRQIFAEAFFDDHLELVDADGAKYRTAGAMTREIYYLTGATAAMSRDWVVVFHVRQQSRGFSLRMTHPDSSHAAFDLAVVPLG